MRPVFGIYLNVGMIIQPLNLSLFDFMRYQTGFRPENRTTGAVDYQIYRFKIRMFRSGCYGLTS